MTELLCRLFIRDRDNVNSPKTRRAYGTMASLVGIVLNILLFAAKFTVGTLAGSVSITADAVNKLQKTAVFLVAAVGVPGEHPVDGPEHQHIAKER